jgi:hypothetical protein
MEYMKMESIWVNERLHPVQEVLLFMFDLFKLKFIILSIQIIKECSLVVIML